MGLQEHDDELRRKEAEVYEDKNEKQSDEDLECDEKIKMEFDQERKAYDETKGEKAAIKRVSEIVKPRTGQKTKLVKAMNLKDYKL